MQLKWLKSATVQAKKSNSLSDILHAGVIGLGKQALEDHIPALKNSPDVLLDAVVEIDEEKLKQFLGANPNIQGYTKVEDLFQKHKLDFVVIVLPHHLHAEVTKEALRHGMHVFKEKPFAVSLNEAKKLDAIAKEQKKQIVVTLQRRFNPIYATFLQLIDKIGVPFYIDAKYTLFTEHPEDGWRGRKELAGGGCLIDMGYHIIDLIMWYFGLPDAVFAKISCAAKERCKYSAEDTAQVLFEYHNKNLWGSLLVSRSIAPKQEFMNVYGTRGSIHLERGKIERYLPNGHRAESLERQNSWPSAMQDQINYFIRVIRGERENISAPEFHYNHLAFIEAAYKSASSHRYINPQTLL